MAITSEAPQLNLDTSAQLDIVLRAEHSFNFTLQFFLEDGTTPLDLEGTFKMGIAKPGIGDPLMTLDETSGLTVSTNSLTISRDVLTNILSSGVYYYDIRNDLGGNLSVPVFSGKILVNQNITQP